MSASLVGSEMCIRDRLVTSRLPRGAVPGGRRQPSGCTLVCSQSRALGTPVSYTHLTLPTICSV
eukprot:12674470-Alexandrium_andersonii.AAC.1